MVHKHSIFAQQRRLAKRVALNNAFQDNIIYEIVNVTGTEEISSILAATFEYVLPGAITVERGEVLLDPRGEGSCQRQLS
jgi:hypothetical protein